jgi:hypothetical protein
MTANRDFGIPDIELPCAKGGTVNPSFFVGHELVVLFCPSDRTAAAKELAQYNARADQLSYNDAWMVAVCDPVETLPGSRITLAGDEDLRGWRTFCGRLDPAVQLPRDEGAVFLFGRGGCLQRMWEGTGHAADVVEELGTRM